MKMFGSSCVTWKHMLLNAKVLKFALVQFLRTKTNQHQESTQRKRKINFWSNKTNVGWKNVAQWIESMEEVGHEISNENCIF